MLDKNHISSIVEEYIKDSGYFLVDIKISQDNDINIEVGRKEGVEIDYCVGLSKHVEGSLDREKEDFSLEVGSAGLTSPFKVKEQYIINIDNYVEILQKGGKKEIGILLEVNDDNIKIEVEKKVKLEGAKRPSLIQEEIEIKFEDILQAKYYFN